MAVVTGQLSEGCKRGQSEDQTPLDESCHQLVRLALSHNAWALVVDREGRIVQLSPEYGELLGIDTVRAVGYPVERVIPNSKMRRVLETGMPEMADLWESNGRQIVISRMPLIWEGRVVGAVAFPTFGNLEEARTFARRLERLTHEPEQSWHSAGESYTLNSLVARSPAFQRALSLARMGAPKRSTILLTGETGTGKEVFAHAIHRASSRSHGPFVKVNCAALPRELLESELFGYENGAFTGARRGGKPGRFELAAGGTLFLDEIGEMPLELQPKLLRVLQDMQVDRLGGTRPTRIDVRLVAATNADLEHMVREGRFRADLFYRLNVVTIALPPLRERREDLPGLIRVILTRLNRELGVRVEGVRQDGLDLLQAYPWPGNIRELENILERVLNEVHSGHLTGPHLLANAPHLAGPPPDGVERQGALGGADLDLRHWLHEAECTAITRALAMAGGNKTRAAELLGIHRTVLHDKIRKYSLSCPPERTGP